MLWPQIWEIHDLHFGLSGGTIFNASHPLNLFERFGSPTQKEKS